MPQDVKTKFAVLVRADDSNNWFRGPQRFDTEEEAREYATNLWHRWRAVRECLIVPMSEEIKQ